MGVSKIMDALREEFLEILKSDSESDREVRMNYLNEIRLKFEEYEQYMNDYNFKATLQALKNRGMKISPIQDAVEIKKKWDGVFTNHISQVDKEKIHYEQFRWHVFSNKVLTAFENDQADQAFLRCKKDETYIFFQHSDECYQIENLNILKEDDVKNKAICRRISDFYIFDMNEKWTYTHTHESQCGPYFYQIK